MNKKKILNIIRLVFTGIVVVVGTAGIIGSVIGFILYQDLFYGQCPEFAVN